MKRTMFALLVAILCIFKASAQSTYLFWDQVIDAISLTESRGKEDVVSHCGRFVGHLQISKILVRQCNQIAGYKKYSYADRFDKEKSNEMFIEYQEHFNPEKNMEKAIRLWNSGDLNCMNRKTRTNGYYNRVMRNYRRLSILADAKNDFKAN